MEASSDVVRCSACGTSNPPGSRYCGKCGRAYGNSSVAIGQVVAERYRILSVLGEGGMGTVYKVEHVQIGKAMAMKILRAELAKDADVLKRFHREAEAASRLSHPNTVQVFDFGRSKAGWMYLVMEYVEGFDLGHTIEEGGAMPFERVASICSQVAASVADAHNAGIVHRDLKPENIMITEGPDGELAKVLDFGLAKIREADSFTSLTQSGSILGTPYFMSPEQIRGLELDGRSDVYSLGAVMYTAVVGSPPFDAETPVGILTKHLTLQLAPPSTHVDVPLEADRIIMKAMQKEPSDRYQGATELREDLRAYLRSVDLEQSGDNVGGLNVPPELHSRPKRRLWPWFLVLVAVTVGAVVGWRALHPRLDEKEPNHEEQQANRLLPGEAITGFLGRRIDEQSGDLDLYRIKLESPAIVEIEVTAIPNMDIIVDVIDPAGRSPRVSANGGGVGEPESLPNYKLEAGEYLLRIREKHVEGQLPTENVSDAYEVRWSIREPDEDEETEPNDSLEQAEPLPVGTLRRGWLGWPGDVDTYCIAEDADVVRARVSRLEGVDLLLRIVDQDTQESRKVDAHGVGKGETSRPFRNAKSGRLCVEVAADPTADSGLGARPDVTYAIEWTRGE